MLTNNTVDVSSLSIISHMYKVDLPPFPGLLEVRSEYTLDGTHPPIHTCTHLPECLAAFPVLLHLVLQGCRVALAKAVNVQNCHQVV